MKAREVVPSSVYEPSLGFSFLMSKSSHTTRPKIRQSIEKEEDSSISSGEMANVVSMLEIILDQTTKG